jgi:hypothetical protein
MDQDTRQPNARRVGTADESPSSGQIPPREQPHDDVVFGILQNARRRHIITYLDSTGSTTIGELSTHLAALENGIDEAAVSSAQRKLIYVSLYQSHLPKLDDAGCISYDSDRGTIEPTPALAEYTEVLDQFAEARDDQPRKRWLYTLASAGMLATLLGLLVAPSVPWLPQIAVVLLAVVLSIGILAVTWLALRH